MLDIIDKGNVVDSLAHKFPQRKVIYVQTDVSDMDNMRRSFGVVFKEFGSIDIVIGNAGIVNEEQQERVIQVNLVRICFITDKT